MDVLARYGHSSSARPLGDLLKTERRFSKVLTARPPFCVGWSISGSQNMARQYANATAAELRRLGSFYSNLKKEDRRLMANHAIWAIRATIMASIHEDETCFHTVEGRRDESATKASIRVVLMECCFQLVTSLDGEGLERLLHGPTDLFHHDALAPPRDILERWTAVCPWIPETVEAVSKLVEAEYESTDIRSRVQNVPVTFVSWTIQVFCSHVYHASLYGTGLGTCSICLDATASAAMSTCLHNMFCPECLEKAAQASPRSSPHYMEPPPLGGNVAKRDESKSNNQSIVRSIMFPCPVCRKVGRIL